MTCLQTADLCCPSSQTRPEGVREAAEAAYVELSSADLKEIREVLDNAVVIGGRYNAHAASSLEK